MGALLAARAAQARNPEQPETAPRSPDLTFLDHRADQPFWFGAEANSIVQYHPPFPAAYSGVHSLKPYSEAAVSGLFTLFFAYRPHRTTELILDGELAAGGGLSSALGVAGFTNLDVVRNPTLSSEPYLARAQIHQIIPLSAVWEENPDRGPISSFARLPRHRLELRAGRMSTADLFDINPAGSDSHLQFMNWSVDNNAAFDYAADTRGYTYGLVVEYQGPIVEARFGFMLMPRVANGPEVEWDVTRAHAESYEVEIKYLRRAGWSGTLRALAYTNWANMGSYQQAIDDFLAQRSFTRSDACPDGPAPAPLIDCHPPLTAVKFGFGLNLYQEISGVARLFARGGWNDGRSQSFAYTEVDDTFELGIDVAGRPWRRDTDRVGVAFVTNGLSATHREYLRLGGLGFLLGDADPASPRASYLDYEREDILEAYYNCHIWRGASVAGDYQLVIHPGYNQDRGPVSVFSLRAHLEF